MKYTGIVRRIDDLGRVVIPKEIRRNLKIREGDPLEIIINDDMVCFKKYVIMPNLAREAQDLRDDVDEIVYHDVYISEERKTVLREASKLIQQAYEKLKHAEKLEKEI